MSVVLPLQDVSLSVLVPTYRRMRDLARCLQALRAQTCPAAQVLVTVRDTDAETQAFFAQWDADGLPVQIVSVSAPGVVAAMNAGLAAAQGDILALTDDDAAPRPDWLARIAAHFAADADVGGVGGRDWLHYPDGSEEKGTHPIVGKVQWHGRAIGNHHLGFGAARDVDALKGVNCAFRITPLRQIGFDTRLRGTGAQVHWELSLCLSLRRAGWKLLYDPAVAVDHYPAARLDEDTNNRGIFHAPSLSDIVYNETSILMRELPPARRTAFLVWATLVGTSAAPGLVQLVRLLLRRDPHVLARWHAARTGRAAGVQTFEQLERKAQNP